MNGIYLLMGSNLGDRLNNLSEAVRILEQKGIQLLRSSAIYETEPWGIVEQPKFLNVVLEVTSNANPEELLQKCLNAEEQLGRRREIKWGARNIDIDILFYKNEIIRSAELTIPHPGVIDRRFTLLPLYELAPYQLHPEINKTMSQLFDNMPDDQSCKRTELHLTL